MGDRNTEGTNLPEQLLNPASESQKCSNKISSSLPKTYIGYEEQLLETEIAEGTDLPNQLNN